MENRNQTPEAKDFQADLQEFIKKELGNCNMSNEEINLNVIIEITPKKFIAVESLRDRLNGLKNGLRHVDQFVESFQDAIKASLEKGKSKADLKTINKHLTDLRDRIRIQVACHVEDMYEGGIYETPSKS